MFPDEFSLVDGLSRASRSLRFFSTVGPEEGGGPPLMRDEGMLRRAMGDDPDDAVSTVATLSLILSEMTEVADHGYRETNYSIRHVKRPKHC